MGCLCGCGGDNLHCLRPNRPPSPNTFYENFWAPEFASLLRMRLDLVATNLEPSKRIWWRETFGGCAPDREPLESETWACIGNDYGNVLRTSPLPVENEVCDSSDGDEEWSQIVSWRQRLASLIKLFPRSPDETANTPLRRLTHGRVHASKSVLLNEKCENPTKHFSDHSINPAFSGYSSARTPTPPLRARPLKRPTHDVPDRIPPLKFSDSSQRHPSRARREPQTEEEDELLHQKGKRKIEATRPRLNRRHGIDADQDNGMTGESFSSTSNIVSVSGADKAAVKRPANDWTRMDDSRKSLFRAPTVRPRAKSPKSPTHYIPDRLPPLKIPDFSKRRVVRHKINIYTAEEDEQARQSGLRKIEASAQRLHLRLYGKPLKGSEVSSTESPCSAFRSDHDHAEEVPPNVQINEMKPTSQESAQLLQLPARKVEANDIEDRVSSAESPPSPSLGEDAAKVPSNTQAKEKITTTEDKKQILEPDRRSLKPTHHQLCDMSVDPATISSAEIPPLTSQSDSTKKIPSNLQKKNPIAEEPQRSRQSLYLKIEAMKLRRSCREGAAIYRYGDAAAESSPSTSGLCTERISSNLQKKHPTTEELQRSRQSLYLKIEAMKMRRNCRERTAIYQFGNASAESSSSTSGLDQVAGMSSTTLPTLFI